MVSARCQVTGRVPGFGKSVSHSHVRTARRFNPNIQSKRYYVPSIRRNIRIDVSAKGMKLIDLIGIDAVVADMARRGEKF